MRANSTPPSSLPPRRVREIVLCLFFAAVILALPAAGTGEPADRPVAWISWLKGEWRVEIGSDSSELSGGQQLPAGARIFASSEKASLRIAFLDGSGVTYTRAGSHPDPSGIVLGALAAEPLSRSQKFLIAMKAFFGAKSNYLPITYRSGRVELEDAVLAWRQGGSLDLTTVFSAALAGDYEIVLQAWVEEPEGPGWRRVEILPYRWQPEEPAAIEVPGLGSGLHRLQVMDRRTSTPGEAWIVLSPAPRFAEHSEAFLQFREQIPWWGGDPDSPEVQGLLRAFLHGLARELAAGSVGD